jgi:hypothetical protein
VTRFMKNFRDAMARTKSDREAFEREAGMSGDGDMATLDRVNRGFFVAYDTDAELEAFKAFEECLDGFNSEGWIREPIETFEECLDSFNFELSLPESAAAMSIRRDRITDGSLENDLFAAQSKPSYGPKIMVCRTCRYWDYYDKVQSMTAGILRCACKPGEEDIFIKREKKNV